MKTHIISVVKMSVLIPATLPRSSIRHTISITYFCADEQMADINRTKNIRLGVDPISHREVTPDAKKCLEILGFSPFPIPSDTML